MFLFLTRDTVPKAGTYSDQKNLRNNGNLKVFLVPLAHYKLFQEMVPTKVFKLLVFPNF